MLVRAVEVGKEVELLEQEAVPAAVGLQDGRVGDEGLLIDPDRAAVGGFQSAEESEQGALAAAGGADQYQHPRGGKAQGQAVERAGRAVGFGRA